MGLALVLVISAVAIVMALRGCPRRVWGQAGIDRPFSRTYSIQK